VDDTFEEIEDSSGNPLAVLTNDSDPGLDPLAILEVGTPDQGGTVVFSNTVITYTPAADFFGFETFIYTITDEIGYQDSALVTVTVTPVNDAPIAFGDSYTITEDVPFTVATPGLLANDSDIENDPLTSTLITGPEHGLLALKPDGSFTYTPTLNYSDMDYFAYQLADATLTDTALVTLTSLPVNDAPIAASDSYTTTENTPLVVAMPGLLVNDSDVEGDVLTATLVSGPAHGTLTLNANGSFVYMPEAYYSGSDSFAYHASDGWDDSNIVSVTITVLPGIHRIYLPVAIQRH
jgi:VCBS repeat-containing protein